MLFIENDMMSLCNCVIYFTSDFDRRDHTYDESNIYIMQNIIIFYHEIYYLKNIYSFIIYIFSVLLLFLQL
jgi:hypothetical protein